MLYPLHKLPPHILQRFFRTALASTMAQAHVILAEGLSSGRTSAGDGGVRAARPESGPIEQLAGGLLFPNTCPDDDRLGRNVYAT